MGLRFIRKPSDTPNVQNSDDTRMIRYAYGGYDGYVQNRGNELNHTTNGLDFVIGTGVVSLQGYETEVDAQGWLMTVTNSPTKHYYSVYYEVNLATQTTDIKHKVSTSGYPDIPTSDDLTQTTTGTAALLLYQFEATSGIISNVQKKVKPIPYVTDVVERVEQGEIVAGKALKTETASPSSNDNTIASTAFVKTALDEKTKINGYDIQALKLIGSGAAGQSTSVLTVNFNENVALGTVLRVVVRLYPHNDLDDTIQILSGDVIVGTAYLQAVSSLHVHGTTFEAYGIQMEVETTNVRCYQGQWQRFSGGSWESGEYGRYIEIYRYR